MHLEILTPEKKLFSDEASAVQFPGAGGSFQVLNNHAPIISSLKNGVISVKHGNSSTDFKVTGGFVEVLNNKVSVLVEGVQQ